MRLASTLLLCVLTLPGLAAPERTEPEPPSADSSLDHGLLDPAWFEPEIRWTRDRRLDFSWIRPEARLDTPHVHLSPWELPRLRSGKDALDRALAGQLSEELQSRLRNRLLQLDGIELVPDPAASPYHAVGRVVEATQIRQGAQTALPLLSGLPTGTWDFKVFDVRTGSVLLATHHRMVGAGSHAWEQFVLAGLKDLVGGSGANEVAWEMPAGTEMVPGLGRRWVEADFDLGTDTIRLQPWLSDTDSRSRFFLSWSSGVGQALAADMRPALMRELGAGGYPLRETEEAAFTLRGRVFSSPKRLHTLYQAHLKNTKTGRIVARWEILAPISTQPARLVAERLAGLMSTLKGARQPSQGSVGESRSWTETQLLVPGPGNVDASWIHPRFSLQGHVLRIADWLPPSGAGSSADEAFAIETTRHAPGWLLGALTPHDDQGFRLSRTAGDLRLEGRVVEIHEADLRKFSTAMAAGFTFGLGTRSHQVFQLRIVDESDQATLLLVQQRVVSFKMASSGTSYKAMKWMAQAFVPWLVKTGQAHP